eukprot:3342776-Rhodomonas_salina.2
MPSTSFGTHVGDRCRSWRVWPVLLANACVLWDWQVRDWPVATTERRLTENNSGMWYRLGRY